MIGYDADKVQLSQTQYAIAGAMSGIGTRFLTQPLDVLKIRFQLQIEPLSAKNAASKYHNLPHAVKTLLKEEGVAALWKGHVPAQFLSVIYGLVQFTTFEQLTKLLAKPMGSSKDPITHFFCGSVAGCVATVAAQPFDVLRTRLVGQGEPKTYRGVIHAVQQMVLKEGYKSFFKGLTPSLIQIAPQNGFQFGFYRLFSQLYELVFPLPAKKTVLAKSYLCGAASGMVAKTLVYPLDLTKKRLQVVGFEDARRSFGTVRSYRGLWQCLQQVVRYEGLKGIFKGFQPTLLKAGIASGLHFGLYEQACTLFGKFNSSRS